ncbi:MAG: hypothetical protein ACKO6N_10275 [Myxococcota bacterium]
MNAWMKIPQGLLMVVGLSFAQGCGEVSEGGPVLLSAQVSCSGEDAWSFQAQVSDPTGAEDIAQVYVDVYDLDISLDTSIGSLDLSNGGDGVWTAEAQPSAGNGLGACERKDRFEFDFFVRDFAGGQDGGSTVAE